MFYNCAVQVASEYGLGDHVQTSYNGSTYNIVHENKKIGVSKRIHTMFKFKSWLTRCASKDHVQTSYNGSTYNIVHENN
jgi:hypothetical protein